MGENTFEYNAKGVYIDTDLCIKCERCLDVCPSKVPDSVCDFSERAMKNANVPCIHCGHCMAVCPTKAFHVKGMSYEDMEDAASGVISKEDLTTYIKNRRSYRDYSDEEVSEETIKEILNTVEYASSGHNQHRCSWGAIIGKEKVKDLADKVIAAVEGVPFFADFVAQYKTGQNILTREASALVFIYMPTNALCPVEDGTVAMTTLELMLPSYGLGGCWGGYMTIIGQNVPQVAEMLHVPKKCKIVGTMLLGYPSKQEQYLRIPKRREAQIDFIK